MQLTRHTDYGLRILMYLGAKGRGHLASIDEVTEVFGLPRNHIHKIVHKLAKHGFIESKRGNGGGIRLNRATDSINLADVVQLLESNLVPVDCQHPQACPLLSSCLLKDVLADAMQAFIAVLRQYTLSDLLARPQTVRWLFDSGRQSSAASNLIQ